jgi:glycosyltransferase involved in cell wall biosynthesis
MFSVVVPVFNKAHTLRRTIAHALAQSYAGFELILVNDGSTDGSLETLKGIVDPRLRVVSQANAGPGAARNRGIAEARHEWTAFLDADDIWSPAHLEELDHIRRSHPEAALIGAGFIDSRRSGRFRWPPEQRRRTERCSYLEAIGAGDDPFFTSSAAARTSVLRELGGFGPFARGEDTELWVRIDLAFPVCRSSRVTVVYVHGTGGITDTMRSTGPGVIPSRPEDLSPAVATALAAVDTHPHKRAAVRRFVDRYVNWSVDSAAACGDAASVRAAAAFHSLPVPGRLRLKMALARLPRPISKPALRLACAARNPLRLVRSRWRASNATGRGPGGVPASPPEA